LFAGLLPKIGNYVPSESIAGFLFVLGAIVTTPGSAMAALSVADIPGGAMVGGITMTVTAISNPFYGMLAGVIFRAAAMMVGM
jgi:AGZA family xanthine/uracil permease-like MFS transporter